MGGAALATPAVGMAAHGASYWIVTADGSIYPFGGAGNFGSG